MSVSIKFIHHPKHGPVWYGCLFGSHKGAPYLIECRYTAKKEDFPLEDGTPPHLGIQAYIIEQIAARAKRMGVQPQAYPDIDKKRKLSNVEIANAALKAMGRADLEKYSSSMQIFNNFIPKIPTRIARWGIDPAKKS